MFKFKLKTIATTLAAAAAFSAAPAHAQGIPVIDIQSILQAILAGLQYATEIENQVTQIEQLGSQVQAITGSRGLGAILNNPLIQNYLPQDTTNILRQVDALGTQGLSATATVLRNARKIYNCENKTGSDQTLCQANLGQAYQSMGFLQDAMNTANGRVGQIQSLMDQISMTDDQKGVNEIQARIEAENALLGHVQSQVNMATGMAIAQQQIQQSRADEARMQQAARTGSLADFVPPSQ